MTRKFSVAKFGGTSVRDVSSIQKCITILNKNKDIKIVVFLFQFLPIELMTKHNIYFYISYENIVIGFCLRSTSTPLRANLYKRCPSIFLALNIGGV